MDRAIPQKWYIKHKKWIFLTSSFVLTMPIILLSFMQTHQKKVTDSIIETATVKLKNYSDSIELIGRVEPRNSYTVIAPISGKVATIFVENGEMVEIGTKLLKLDSDDVKARISKKSISIQEQDATVRSVLQSIDSEKFKFKKNVLNLKGEILTLDDDIKNKRILSLEGFISKSSVVELQNRRDRKAELLELEIESYESLKVHTSKKLVSSKAKLTQLKKDLSLLNDKLTSAEVTSKFSGQLVHFNPTLGDQIGENSIIGQIQSFDGFQVSANVDQYYLRHFEFGQKAKATINGKEGIFTLSRLNPTVVDGHFVATWEASDDTKHNVTGGQNVSIKHNHGLSRQRMVIPIGDYMNTRKGSFVYIIDEENQAVAIRRDVVFGNQSNGFVEVLSGLSLDDEVIISDYSTLGSKSKIRIKNFK